LAKGLAALAEKIDPKLSTKGAERIVERMESKTDPSEFSWLAEGLAALGEKIDPKLTTQGAERIVERMGSTTDPFELSSLAERLSDLKHVEFADNAQNVVHLLNHPLAVMPLLVPPDEFGMKDPRNVMDCLLAFLGRGLRKEPFPNLQSFVDWANAHPNANLDLERAPTEGMSN
jgi:hypothetical protein